MISPWAVYLIEVLYNIDMVANLALFILICIGACLLLGYFSSWKINYEEGVAFCEKYSRYMVIAMAIVNIPILLIPEREAMYRILIAIYLTPENIEILRSFGIETIQQLSDVITESIGKAVQKGE